LRLLRSAAGGNLLLISEVMDISQLELIGRYAHILVRRATCRTCAAAQ
jgi:hypothetical protein